jgi:hypothetical protein
MSEARPKTFLSGAGLVWKWQRLVWWVFAVGLILSLVGTRGMLDRVSAALDHSMASSRLTNGFDLSAVIELASMPDAPLQVTQSGGATVSLVFLIFMVFTTGGIIATYVRDERPEVGNFFEACGYHFWRFFRLTIYLLIALIPVGIVVAIAVAMNSSIDEKSISPMPAVHFAEGAAVLVLFLLMVVRLWFDMTEVIAVAEDEKRMHKALRLSAVLLAKNFFSLFWLYLRISVVSWLVMGLALYLWMARLSPASNIAAFLIGQLAILFWIGTRLWQRASEAQWYREFRSAAEMRPPVWSPAPATPVVVAVPAGPAVG